MGLSTSTHVFLCDENCHGRVQSGAESDGGRALNPEFVHHSLRPLRGSEHLDLLPHKADRVRLGDGVLEFPPLQRLLREGDKLFAGRDGEDTKVLVLCAVLELLRPLPGRQIRSTGREADLDDVREREFLEKLCALRQEDADA